MADASPSVAGSSGRLVSYGILASIFIFGLDAMHLQLQRNGYLAHLEPLLEGDGPRFFPGTSTLILKHYLGFPAWDRLWAMTNVFFANVTDGSRPEFSLLAYCFAGQLVPFFLVMMIESQRVAKWSGLLNPIVWGLAMQCFGLGVVGPVFFIVHLLLTSGSKLSETVRLADPVKLHTVIPAFSIGYFLITALVALPFKESNVHQWTTVLWQYFPVYVVAAQWVFTNILKRLSLGQSSFVSPARQDRRALSYAYDFAWNVAVVTQLSTYVVIIVGGLVPHEALPEGTAEILKRLKLGEVFGPEALPHSYEPMASPAAAMHDFFIYDFLCGSLAAITWGVYLVSQVTGLDSWDEIKDLARGIVNSLLLSGPGGALIALVQHRDELVLVKEAKAEKSK